MTIEFWTRCHRKQFNWTGEIPQKGDMVILHLSSNDNKPERYIVQRRIFNDMTPERVSIELEWIDK